MAPGVRRVHEGCHNHIQSVELERRERGILSHGWFPILLVECEAGEHRPGIAAGTDERRHTRELFRHHGRDQSVAGTY